MTSRPGSRATRSYSMTRPRTNFTIPSAVCREVTEADSDRIFEHKVEGVGDWLIEQDGIIVATGGVALHYNPPYGDIFMEVDEPHRRCGYGSYLVQESSGSATRWAGYPLPVVTRRTSVPGRRCKRPGSFPAPGC